MHNAGEGPDPVPYTGPQDDGVPMIGRATPKPPHGTKPKHDHEAWQIQDTGDGRQYCAACGDNLTVAQVEALSPGFYQNIMKIEPFVKGEKTNVVNEVIDGRRGVYGEPVETYPRIAEVWSGILGHPVTAVDVPLMMIGYKLVRAAVTPDYSDNSDDVEGYLAIFRELVGADMIHARSVEDYLRQRRG